MLNFKSLSFKNFLSYGNVPTVIHFNHAGTTLIEGENLDDIENGLGRNGVGKFQHVDCKVKTTNGWIRMGDIQVGQVLQMPDGSSAPVVKIFPQGTQQLYKITFVDGRSTLAGGPHLWKVFSHRWEQEENQGAKIATTEDLIDYINEATKNKNNPLYNIFVPTINHPNIKDKRLPIDPYILGISLNDDSFSKVQGCVASRFIPKEYLEGTSKQQKLDLLAGLLDTDGIVSKTKNVSFCSISKQLATDVQYLVRSLGGEATITSQTPFYINSKGNRIDRQLTYNVSIRYSNPRKLFHVDRKKERLSKDTTQYTNEGLQIVSIERVKDGECKCIMVDHPDHLYITDDFIVTHNTAVINALLYGVFDKPLSDDITKDELINNINEKNLEVIVDFETNEKNYRIVRARRSKKGPGGNYVQLFENGKDITPDSVANTNKLIEKIIKIPYELFVRIVVFSAGMIPFLDMPVRSHYAANQTDIIEELFDLKTLSKKAVSLKEAIKEKEQSLEGKIIRIDHLKKEHERLSTQLKTAETRVINWHKQNKTEIDRITNLLKKIDSVDLDSQQQLHGELNAVNTKIEKNDSQKKKINQQIKKHVTIETKMNDELLHLRDDECPYCLQKYADGEKKIKECEAKLKEAVSSLSDLKHNLEDVLNEKEELLSIQKSTQKQITVTNIEELIDIKNKSTYYKTKIKELEDAQNPFVEPLQELQSIKLEPLNMDEINELNDLITHQKFLLKLLTRKDSFVRKTLLNKNIPFMNSRLQKYITELGLSHFVEFTHEMTARISKFGKPMSFGGLSNGQRARVNLALSLAFKDVLQKLHDQINVFILDEVLDIGLDTVGVQNAVQIIKRKAREEKLSVYVISHRDEITDGAFDNTMTIQLDKGFSYVKCHQNKDSDTAIIAQS